MNLFTGWDETICVRLMQTLMHFLWQGTAVALLALGATALLRRASARARYNVLAGALLLMTLCPVVTFLGLEPPTCAKISNASAAEPIPAVADLGAPAPVAETPERTIAFSVPEPSLKGVVPSAPPAVSVPPGPPSWSSQWQPYALPIALAYLGGVLLMLGRLVLAVRGGQRLRQSARPVADTDLVAAVARLARVLGLAYPPAVAWCERLTVPTVIGVLRPTILLPLTFTTGLTIDQVEALLTHELAHLRRHDHLVNFLQRLIEAVLFFHPAVWWVSRQIRLERELCCDDLVLATGRSAATYAASLLHIAARSLQIGKPTHVAAALSAAGQPSQLRRRILRILEGPSAPSLRLTRPGHVILGTIIAAVFGTALFLFSKPTQPEGVAADPADKAPAEGETITGRVVDADDKPLPNVEIRVYQSDEPVKGQYRTDDQGRFQVPRSWAAGDDQYHLIVRPSPDRLGWYTLSEYSPPGKEKPEKGFQIKVLPRTRTLQGTLVSAKGQPLAKVPVKVQFLDNTWLLPLAGDAPLGETVTDEQGRFTLKVPPCQYCFLVPVDPRYIRKRLSFKENQQDLGRVQLTEAGSITGRVTDAAGNPVVGAEVGAQAYNADYDTGGWGAARTDQDGRYTIVSLKPGACNVLFSGSRTQPKLTAPAREAVQVEAGKKVNVDLHAIEGRLLTGKVVGIENNQPLVNCHVGYYGTERPRSGACCKMVRTDAKGEFRFYAAPGACYVYVAEGQAPPDGANRTLEVAADKDPEPVILKGFAVKQANGVHTVCISAPGEEQKKDYSYTLRGTFRTRDGKPVAGMTYWLFRKGSSSWSQSGAHSGAEFEVPLNSNDDGQTFALVIEATGFARPKPREFVAAKKIVPVTIDLEPAVYVTIRGTMVDQTGKPIAGARVRVALWLGGSQAESPWGVEPTTDAQGGFVLKHLRVGDRFQIRADKKGRAGAVTQWIVADKPGAIDLANLSMGPAAGEVVGTVTDPDGKPIVGARVIYNDLERKEAKTDERGVFGLTRLPDGDINLTIEAPGFERWPHRVKSGTFDWKVQLRRLSQDER
jgi:beta-lactamase regulating signal transducer with metallopeptidase domain/protocatechuate 3,4-dioxygenase beta subunit